jgi:hypothetical protein
MSDRRTGWDAGAVCAYCGAIAREHDRLARQWEACSRKAAWFGPVGSALEPHMVTT